uniref:Uncharacterized protein n=1 Tax=Glossina pallidipes TaxID=7398 RepID=A0A1A9ZRU4_GLOPL
MPGVHPLEPSQVRAPKAFRLLHPFWTIVSHGLWTDTKSYCLRMYLSHLEVFIMSKNEMRSNEKPRSKANGGQPRQKIQNSIIAALRNTHQHLSYANGLDMV